MVATESRRMMGCKSFLTRIRTRNFALGLPGTVICSICPASIPATRTLAPFSSPAISPNSAYTRKVSPNTIRRFPIRKIPTAKSRIPPITNAPTAASRLTCSSRLLRSHECAHQWVLVLIQILDRATRRDTPVVQHDELVRQAARAGHVVRHDNDGG